MRFIQVPLCFLTSVSFALNSTASFTDCVGGKGWRGRGEGDAELTMADVQLLLKFYNGTQAPQEHHRHSPQQQQQHHHHYKASSVDFFHHLVEQRPALLLPRKRYPPSYTILSSPGLAAAGSLCWWRGTGSARSPPPLLTRPRAREVEGVPRRPLAASPRGSHGRSLC